MDADHELRLTLARCIAAVFGLAEEDVLQANDFAQIDGWDSLRHLQLMAEVEKEFHCSFSVDDIVSVSALDQMVALIRKKAG